MRTSLSANQRRSGMKLGSTSSSKVRRVQLDSAFSQPCPSTSVVTSRGRTFSGSRLLVDIKLEPEEAVGRQRDEIGQLADARKARAAEHFLRDAAFPRAHVELDRLRRARDVGDA